MSSIFISRVQIKNFRNFKDVDVLLSHKQVILGENNAGKTNFLRALQLILDPSLSDNDRNLSVSDFHDSIIEPTKNGSVIEIGIEIQGYYKNSQIIAKFQDAVISDDPPTLRIDYKFSPVKDDQERIIEYQYSIYMGGDSKNQFTPGHRYYLNLHVIRALRDVEREMKALKKSPVYKLVEQFSIPNDELEKVAKELKKAADSIMEIDELIELKLLIENKFKSLSGTQPDCEIELSTFDIDPNRLLHALQLLLGNKQRPVSEISLGLCNILYITLMLLLIRDRTVPSIIRAEKWNDLFANDSEGLLDYFYDENENGNYLFNKELLEDEDYSKLYLFMNRNLFPSQAFTILAVEEPEAHLHPVLQRLIYREVLQKSATSVIFTTHSTHITSVAPINSIVHVRSDNERISNVLSAAKTSLTESEKEDMQVYLDARRGELYFGLGVILVEGIAEELLVPRFAELLGYNLDASRIIVCNINSTNFEPFVNILKELGIHWCVITDGDYYQVIDKKREYHVLKTDASGSYRGLEIAGSLLVNLGFIEKEELPDEFDKQEELFNEHGIFIGTYTLEVDIMESSDEHGDSIIKEVFSELKPRGPIQQKNFDTALDDGRFFDVLGKIEMPGIGKGRFAQRLSSKIELGQIPPYIINALNYIVTKVSNEDE